ncbi:MAG: ribonuclease T [Sphingobacteriia bacterium]|nr:ribonuclease T [Sphingobacteriia bacterium]NCC39984.1 ribonuclease T [Gammaproteobacteria bacterium]
MNQEPIPREGIAARFRGFLPVVVDVETAGFDPQRHALLEIAAVIIRMAPTGHIEPSATIACHVLPFVGAEIDPSALAFNRIDPDHPFRDAVSEHDALQRILTPIRKAVKSTGCTRAILVGHNAHFDLGFIKAAVERTGIKRNPFHAFSVFDTVSLAGLMFGQTVLAKASKEAGLGWQSSAAHSAIYDAEQTARLFCTVVNRWRELDRGCSMRTEPS